MTEAEAQAVIDGMMREGTLRLREVTFEVAAGIRTVAKFVQPCVVTAELFNDKVAFANWALSTQRNVSTRRDELLADGGAPLISGKFS